MSNQPTCADTSNAISSQELAAGRLPYGSPDFMAACGLVHALANLSHQQVKALGLTISGISGPRGSISSASADLSLSLGSKLQQQLGSAGSTLFKQTWKAKATASEQPYWAHTASAHRTSDSDCGGWPTTRANDAEKRGEISTDPRNGLPGAARLASWPTPTASLADKCVRTTTGGIREAMRNRGADLAAMACLASWVTPSARDWKDSPGMATTGTNPDGSTRSRMDQLPRQASGVIPTGFPVSTGKPGQLNPAHSRWLMGYPREWCDYAPTETPSSRQRAQRSSEPT